jgi:hypothetical protein
LSKRSAASVVASVNGPKVLHLKNGDADCGLEDYLTSKIDDMQSTICSLQDQLQREQQLFLQSQSRAQRLEEDVQQITHEYEQLLTQYVEEIEHLKLDHAKELHAMQLQQASVFELKIAQLSTKLKGESERAVAAESERLEKLQQRLQEQQQQVLEERAKLQVQRSAIEMQVSTAEVALSTVAHQQANMLVQKSQLNSDSDSAKSLLQLQQVSAFVIPPVSMFCFESMTMSCLSTLTLTLLSPQKHQVASMQDIQDIIVAKEQQLALQQSKVAEELRHLHTLTDVFSADFIAAQSTISQKLCASLQDMEQGQRNLQVEWIALIEQQEALGTREQRLQHVITSRITTQLCNRLKRLLLSAKAKSWRTWMSHVHRRSYKRFKFHAAFKLRCRCILAASFTRWHNRLHVVVVNKFQNLATDREARLLEKSSELQMLHSASVQREMQLQHDLAEALSFTEQETQRAEKLQKTVTLQDAYIVQYEQENHQLQLLRDTLFASKDQLEKDLRLQTLAHRKIIEEKDLTIVQYHEEVHRHHQSHSQNQFLRDEIEAITLQHAAAEEHRVNYRRTKAAGRMVKRLRYLTMARAIAAWIDFVRDAREELLVDSLERLQNGVSSQETLLQSLRQQLKQKQDEGEAIKLQHAAAEQRLLKTINELQSMVESARVERAEMIEMISLLEIRLQIQTAEQQQPLLEIQSIKSYEEVEAIKLQHAAAEQRLLKTINELQSMVESARVERAEMLEMISLLEIRLQRQTAEQQQPLLETQSWAQ